MTTTRSSAAAGKARMARESLPSALPALKNWSCDAGFLSDNADL